MFGSSKLFVLLGLVLLSLGLSNAEVESLKINFLDNNCKGTYDASMFAKLDRICEDCYNLFREPELHQKCRKDCFTSDMFKPCVEVLLLEDELDTIKSYIKQLHGAEP